MEGLEMTNEKKLDTRNDHSRVWLEVDLDILEQNFKRIRDSVKPLKVMAVLKANAYGLGVMPIAERLLKAGADGFCVAELREAIQLKPFGKPIQILGSLLDFELEEAVRNGFILGITDYNMAKMISDESVRQGVTTEVHFKIDSGMGRLGILAKDTVATAKKVVKLPNLNCCGIYSHFPAAANDELSLAQASMILELAEKLESAGIHLEKRHIANSDAVNTCPFATVPPFTQIRTGINLLGSFNANGERELGLESVVTIKTRIVQIRELPAGHTIGYNRTCRLPVNTKVATIAAGYADGIPLNISNRGYVVVRGSLCPIIGKISMDYTTIRLDGFEEEIQPGEEVILIGGSGCSRITIADWANIKGTHPYEILCSIGHRVNRTYISKKGS